MLTSERTQSIRVPAGGLVCVAIVNGNAINYAYSLGVTIDSTSAGLPDLSKQVSLVKTLFDAPKTSGAPRTAGDAAPSPPWVEAMTKLARQLVPLDSDLAKARMLYKLADKAEPPELITKPLEAKAGLRFALDSMLKLPGDSGRFNDGKLKESLQHWVDEAMAVSKGDVAGKVAVAGLAGFADGLRSERDQILDAFKRADPDPEVCGTVGRRRSTLSLLIAKKDSTVGARGLSKDMTFRIVNDAPYERPLVSVAPVGLAIVAPGAPEFIVNNGTLESAGPRGHFRPGIIVALNRSSGGPYNAFATSYAIGVASAGVDGLISDFFGAVLISLGDFVGSNSEVIRIGLGLGVSKQQDHVSGFNLHDPYPQTAGELDDRIKRDWKPAVYLTFTLPSLGIGTK